MHEALERLYSAKTKKFGLDNIRSLLAKFGNPEKKFPAIHIAGTNGKGSVAHKIARALTKAGYKTALFTSPHISTFRERIQIDGTLIPEEKLLPLLPDLPGSFFELTTLAAFRYFADEVVDYAVIETGLGGRLDATNVLNPILTIITSISYDHENILGSNLKQIAREKAGICKEGVPLILGPNTPHLHSNLKVQGEFETFDQENQAIAKLALQQLGIEDPDLSSNPPCRLEKIPFQGKTVILDVAHNQAAIHSLFKSMTPRPNALLFALSKEKNHKKCLDIIKQQKLPLFITEGASPRSQSKEILAKGIDCQVISPLKAAFQKAFTKTPKGGTLLCFGTFFMMSEIRTLLGLNEPRDAQSLSDF